MRMGSNLYPEYTVRRLSLELLSKLKPRVYELDGTEYVRSRVASLEVGVLAESILRDYRHEFERVDDGGIVGIGCIVGECARWVRVLCGRFLRPDLLIHLFQQVLAHNFLKLPFVHKLSRDLLVLVYAVDK